MPYDLTHHKVSRIIPGLGNSAPLKCENVSFTTRIFSPRHLGLFYGTDIEDVRNGYGSTLLDALRERIAAPVDEVWQHKRACFFKPYQSVRQGVGGALDGLLLPAMTTIQALGLLGTFGSPYGVIGAACFSAAVELISGVLSLGQSLYHKIKYSPNQTVEERARAGEYFQDAVTRFALVIPLAMVSLVAVPAEFIRFFTRCIASLVKLVSGYDLSAHAEDSAHVEASERTHLLADDGHAAVAPSM